MNLQQVQQRSQSTLKYVQNAIHSIPDSRELHQHVVLLISSIADMELSRTNTVKKNETVAKRRRRQHNRIFFERFGCGKTESLMRWSYFFRRKYEGFGDERISCS